ncbi:potassium-transporting ATPase subunit F [Leucobacter coleopterorum]|uniref:Potassium-transporting ATPase subunit F n=1 Tax=Leucobacter coleopterorum TaxID=2714933 RepID=A0ABX6JTT8_9MICO|nr:potassium-transporting ATPase subunit F [Leucobacter coleopterorum]QIM17687.1 potassium-transporting ATPase subunit F [Leucobacter coleopterorum]
MIVFEAAAGVLGIGALVYLVIALVKPEKF